MGNDRSVMKSIKERFYQLSSLPGIFGADIDNSYVYLVTNYLHNDVIRHCKNLSEALL